MATIPDEARRHFRELTKIQTALVLAARRSWRRVDADFISESWNEQVVQLAPTVTQAQSRAAFEGGTYSAMTLANQGVYVAPSEFTDPRAFSGHA